MPISSSTSTAGQIVRYLKRRSVKRPTRSPNPRGATVVAMGALVKGSREGPRRHARMCRRGPLGSVRIGVGLARPLGISLALGIDPDLLGDRIPLRGHVVENGLRLLTGPKAREALAQGLLVLVGLDQRQVEQTADRTG